MIRPLRPLTQKDLEDYEWIDVSSQGEDRPIWIRGGKKTSPPNDGFVYKENTRFNDTERKWERVYTYDEPK